MKVTVVCLFLCPLSGFVIDGVPRGSLPDGAEILHLVEGGSCGAFFPSGGRMDAENWF